MTIFPAESVSGTLFVPGDKSISHRAIIFAALSDGVCKIHKYLNCDDCRATISCLNKLGVATDTAADTLYVHGVGMHGLKSPGGVLYTANSGTTTRLLTGLLSAQNFNSIIDGDASIRKRPMARVIAPLIEMGAHIKSRIGGLCPIEIRPSSLSAIRYTLPVASAQLKSALILAALYAHGESIIKTPRVCRTHTEHMLKHLGANVSDDGDVICISKTENIQPFELSVPADISSAAFFIVAALILPNSRLTLKNVGINSSRTGVLDVLRNMGGNIEITNIHNDVEPYADIVVESSKLHGVRISGDIIPNVIDELPILAVAAAFADGFTTISDALELRNKESDRISAMVCELKKAHIEVAESPDGMIIYGGSNVSGASFSSHNDHRVAMSMAILSLAATGGSTIDGVECISISYPDFFDDLNKIVKWR